MNSGKKSNKMPWLVTTTPAQHDRVEDSPSMDKPDTKVEEDRVPESHSTTKTTKQSEMKSVCDKVVCTLHMFHFP